jgi:hypothetical protein
MAKAESYGMAETNSQRGLEPNKSSLSFISTAEKVFQWLAISLFDFLLGRRMTEQNFF